MDVFLTGIPKKLLVATSVLVIVTMCLKPAEAATIEHKRHRLHEHIRTTKDTGAPRPESLTRDHRRRHQGSQMRNVHSTKELGSLHNDLYENAGKIEDRVTYLKHMFDEGRQKLTEPSDYGTGMPLWLPKTNFVDIHSHISRLARKNETSNHKKIVVFSFRKLYKSLLEYYELFKIFQQVEVINPDNNITDYNFKRKDFFVDTIKELNNAICDIKEFFVKVKLPEPKVNLSRLKSNDIEKKVDGAKYLKNDNNLLRGYGNVLQKWHLEFKCSKSRIFGRHRKISARKCRQYQNSIKEKLVERRKKRITRKVKKGNA
ncbi:hypothetical protein ACJJTC_019735 [Scirpophaga incertulas]